MTWRTDQVLGPDRPGDVEDDVTRKQYREGHVIDVTYAVGCQQNGDGVPDADDTKVNHRAYDVPVLNSNDNDLHFDLGLDLDNDLK